MKSMSVEQRVAFCWYAVNRPGIIFFSLALSLQLAPGGTAPSTTTRIPYALTDYDAVLYGVHADTHDI